MPALATSSASIPWINCNQGNTGQLRLIFNKLSKFVKGPLPKSFFLRFLNRDPKAIEIFNRNSLLGVFGNLNDSFGNGVVCMSFESSFPTREFFQMSFGRFRATFLQRLFKPSHTFTHIINLLTGKLFAITGSNKIDDAKINSEYPARINRSAIGQFYAQTKKKIAVNAENGNSIKIFKGENTIVINNSRMFLENMETLFISPIGFGNLANSPNGELCGKTVSLPDNSIDEMVKSDLPEFLLLKGNHRNVVAGFVENLDGSHQRNFLLFGRKQFDFNCELHGYKVKNLLYNVNHYFKKGGAAFLPAASSGVSSRKTKMKGNYGVYGAGGLASISSQG